LAGVDFADAGLGFTSGNGITFNFGVTNTLRYSSKYNFGRANDSVFRYYLERVERDYHEGLVLEEMANEWQRQGLHL
jgi:hypothetical protein